MEKKRLIIALIFLLVCIGIGYLIYRVFFYKPPTPLGAPTGTSTQGQFPQTEEGANLPFSTTSTLPTAENLPETNNGVTTQPQRETEIVNTTLSGATKDSTGGARFYNQLDGKFYRVDKNGNIVALDDQVFYSVQKVNWSPNKNEAILEYPDGNKIYYNFDTKQQATLPAHWENFSFTSQGEKIAAKSLGLSTENRWLITSDPNGQNAVAIEPMGDNADAVNVDWSPNGQIIATSLTGEVLGDDRQEVLFVGQHHENFKSTIVEGQGLVTQWSPKGNQLLYSVFSERSDFKPELWIVTADPDHIGENRRLLGLNTWANKCNFSDERYVYCAAPTTLDTGSGFAPGLADNTPDNIYKIDLQTGLQTQIPLNNNHTINNLFTGSDGKTLYFTDKNQSGLFSVPLK